MSSSTGTTIPLAPTLFTLSSKGRTELDIFDEGFLNTCPVRANSALSVVSFFPRKEEEEEEEEEEGTLISEAWTILL